MNQLNYNVKGMHCTSCTKVIEGIFGDENIDASVDFEKCMLNVPYSGEKERLKILKALAQIRKRGYKISNA